jgi:biopolymer transport protein TolR
MVPFIDVVLVLLIIFMITAPILQSGIEVDLPKTHTVREITEQRLVVTVDKAQTIYLGNDPVNIHELPAKIKKQLKHPNDAVFLRCDETVPFGSFASVIDSLRVSGISNISIVTEPVSDRKR